MPLCYLVSRNLPRKPPRRPLNSRERGNLGGSYLLDAKTCHAQRLQKRRSHQVRSVTILSTGRLIFGLTYASPCSHFPGSSVVFPKQDRQQRSL